MVPIFGVPFLERTLLRLRDAGITEVILPAGYLPEAITSYFGTGERLGMKLTYVIEDTPLGTAGALKNIEHLIEGPFFVLNGDVLTGLDLRAMLEFHKERGGLGVLHLIRVDDPSAFGCVVHDAAGRITSFIEKPPRGTAPTNAINAGTYLLEREVLEAIPAGRSVSIERETFPQLLALHAPLHGYTTSDYWIDLGRPEHYLQAHADILAGKLGLPGVPSVGLYAGTSGRVHVDPRATIDPAALLGPTAVIGAGSRIGAGARVARSVLWENVIVGPGASIEGAILASGVRVGAGAHIESGAVIGHDAVIEAGTLIKRDARIPGPAAPV
jgi:mannose-1-phosphate guanylyltransferase